MLVTDDGEHWTTEMAVIESRHKVFSSFDYEYQVRSTDNTILRREWTMVTRALPCDNAHDYLLNDSWKDIPLTAHLYTKAVITTSDKVTVAGGMLRPEKLPIYRKTLIFKISAPQLKPGKAMAICGSHPSLGGWSQSRYLKMIYCGRTVWTLSVNADALLPEVEYKYVVIDEKTHNLVEWEGGDNRHVGVEKMRDGEVQVLDNGTLRIAEDTWRVAGVAIPVFSLRSEHSCGVGDFGDIKRFADWMAITGMKVMQILPVNDTTMQHNWQDSYPYNIISVNALHPQYLDLEQVGKLADATDMTDYNRRRTELNSLDHTDYEAVEKVKHEYLKTFFYQNKNEIEKDEMFRHFEDENSHWLIPYVAFTILRDRYNTARFSDWNDDADYDRKKAKAIFETDEGRLVSYCQYLLHTQLKNAAEYAASIGITIMGDMPVGVSRDSAEMWANPSLFNKDFHAGTMPDNINRTGQNWGFPTYNWDAIEAEHYKWWHQRLKVARQYFGALRIDHVLGFFRIWEIPDENTDGLKGHFAPSLPMNENEMGYYGLSFHRDSYTNPIINDAIINRIFGIHANYVREKFLVRKDYDLYALKPECSSQKKIHELFGGRGDENSIWIRDGLCRLAANVLFVPDRYNDMMFHPRVNAFSTTAYQMLSGEDRDAFMRLYNNYYFERHKALWELVGRRRLSMIFNGCDILACAEDLGHNPSCVGNVLEQLRIPTLEIQTMPKNDDTEFAHLEANPYLSVTTISTHDMAPMRLWWQDNQQKAQHYYSDMMQKEGRAPEQLTTVLAEEIVARHLYSPSMMCILSLQDWLAIDGELRAKNIRGERINTPGDSYNRWKYRMHLSIEQLMEQTRYNSKIKTMITRSRR